MGYKTDAQGNRILALKELRLGREPFLRTDDNSALMSIDGVSTGAPVVLWNGTGVDDTGSDWTRTGAGAETTASKKNGTNGLDTGVTALNDECVFDNGSMIDIDSLYSELQCWMQVKAYPPGSKCRLRFVDASDNIVGNQVLVDNYVDNMDVDVWKQVSIPIADFGLTGNAQKLEIRFRQAAGQHFWFDDIEVISAGGGGPYRFRITPPATERWHLSMAVLLMAAPASGWVSTAFANIVGGLNRGLVFRHHRLSTSETLSRFITRNNMQLFGQYHPQEDVTFADAVLLWGFMVKPGRATMIITADDILEFVVRDDLTDIQEMRAFCHFGVEEVG